MESAGWSAERTQRFRTQTVELNHGIEQLGGRAWDRFGGTDARPPDTGTTR
ncbi:MULTISPECIES: hypothetical protein [unclassified Streptomyces]|uniref:hypothetical protein n=1 Tax=unclassified Streptomyces TaxID=2593676 RepID=UPI0023492998|nr:hypothetical protein [Streptomyces sp. M92]WCN06217.1 hypothetical protein M6G08_31320 [Streptomyces sp. M92]